MINRFSYGNNSDSMLHNMYYNLYKIIKTQVLFFLVPSNLRNCHQKSSDSNRIFKIKIEQYGVPICITV